MPAATCSPICGDLPPWSGFPRQHFPKGTDLARRSPEELQAVSHALNSGPRKTGPSPHARFQDTLVRP